jgi:hypothetical protein
MIRLFLSLRSKPLKRLYQKNLQCACGSPLFCQCCHFARNGLAILLANSFALRQAAPQPPALQLCYPGRDHNPRERKDCSARSAKSPAPIHRANRASPQLLLRIPNNWAQSGRRPEDGEKWRLYKTAGKVWPGSSSSTASLHGGKYLHNFCIQLRKLQSQHAFAGM